MSFIYTDLLFIQKNVLVEFVLRFAWFFRWSGYLYYSIFLPQICCVLWSSVDNGYCRQLKYSRSTALRILQSSVHVHVEVG